MRRPTVSDRLYQTLLLLFPKSIRAEFGDDMAQLFRDQHASRRGNPRAQLRLWVLTVIDVFRNATAERVEKGRRTFGSPSNMLHLLDAFRSDLLISLRALWLRPAITLGAVLSLAIGIGATATAFGAMYGIMLRPLPYSQPEELVAVSLVFNGEQTLERREWPFPHYRALVELNREFSSLSAYWPSAFNLGGVSAPERVSGEYVSASYLRTL